MYYVHIMANTRGTIYIGVTNNLSRRVIEHKYKRGGKFVEKYKRNKLVYCEEYQSRTEAITREKQLKGWKRKKKQNLIKELNPHWIDLFE